jgi:hypothetical protein
LYQPGSNPSLPWGGKVEASMTFIWQGFPEHGIKATGKKKNKR